jgi:hypothetical protein
MDMGNSVGLEATTVVHNSDRLLWLKEQGNKVAEGALSSWM